MLRAISEMMFFFFCRYIAAAAFELYCLWDGVFAYVHLVGRVPIPFTAAAATNETDVVEGHLCATG